MTVTIPDEIAINREIALINPEPPYEKYRYEYFVRSGPTAMSQLEGQLSKLNTDRFFLITDHGVPSHMVSQIQHILTNVAPCSLHIISGGERAKTVESVATIGNEALAQGATRASVIVALGGGLVGNIAGLVAGILHRGVRLVHLPTTFLAMSDSCLSLKQGVNSNYGKNHFGMFKPPIFVWSDLTFTQTLPPSEVRAALSELIKNVLAICPDRYDNIASNLNSEAKYTYQQFAQFIDFCIDAKCSVMDNDGHEKHDAVILEYGHTVGHAIEKRSNAPDAPWTVSHGNAVAIGLSIEAEIAHRLGLLKDSDVEAHENLLRLNGSTTTIPSFMDIEDLIEIMRKDNKRGYLPSVPGTIDMVLLEGLGIPHHTAGTVITHVKESYVRAALETHRA